MLDRPATTELPPAATRALTRRWLAVAALVVALLPGFDSLRDEEGKAVKWPSRAVAVFVEARAHGALSPAQIGAVTRKAMKNWNAALPGGTQLVWGGLVAADPRFDIFIRMSTKDFADRTKNPTGRLRIDADSGELRRVRIELDAAHFVFSTSASASALVNADLQATLTHQLGHALGLGFSRERDAALYYFVVTAAQRALADDDRRGIRWLYGEEAPAPGRLCDACDGDAECDGKCLTWPNGGSYCARPCTSHDTCPVGYSCGSWPGGNACLPNDEHCAPDRASAPVSGKCANDFACPKRLFCLATGGEGFCSAGCTGFCDGFGQCRQVQLGGQVVGLCLAGKNRAFGERCEVAPDCGSLVCTPSILGGGYCARACASGCPKGANCDADGKFCVRPGELGVGWPCGSGFDCASNLCVAHGAVFAKVCAITCGGAADCPAGSGCTPTANGMFCLPFGTPPPGAPCATIGACGGGSLCDEHPMAGVGRCAPTCDPYSTNATCPSGMRCAWVGAASSTAGACRPSGPGALLGVGCDVATPCRTDLVCAATADGAGTCHAVCDPAGAACPSPQTCVALADSGAAPSVCASAEGPLTWRPAVPPSASGANFAARSMTLPDLRAYGTPAKDDAASGGCTAAPARRAAPGAMWPVLALMTLVLTAGLARRRWLRRV